MEVTLEKSLVAEWDKATQTIAISFEDQEYELNNVSKWDLTDHAEYSMEKGTHFNWESDGNEEPSAIAVLIEDSIQEVIEDYALEHMKDWTPIKIN